VVNKEGVYGNICSPLSILPQRYFPLRIPSPQWFFPEARNKEGKEMKGMPREVKATSGGKEVGKRGRKKRGCSRARQRWGENFDWPGRWNGNCRERQWEKVCEKEHD
jgi:hypothetical protein